MTGIGLSTTSVGTTQQSFNFNNNSLNTKAAVYASKGEPMYQKEMDEDEDGVITFQEFMDYCDANGIGYKERVLMLNNRMTYHLNKKAAESSEKVQETAKEAEDAKDGDKVNEKSESEQVYARKGDSNYDEVIDGNQDGKITYEEYMEYCQKQAESSLKTDVSPKAEAVKTENPDTKEEKIVVKDYAKALKSYTKSEPKAEGKIENEA